MKLRWTPLAVEDLREIGSYIALDDRRLARHVVRSLRKQARRAMQFPEVGRRVPEFERDDLRELLHANYRIVYLVRSAEVVVISVFRARRRFPESALDDV